MKKRILFVDDERQILRALRRLFSKTEYEILLAPGGQEALSVLEKESVDMLVTDMRMPGMDGQELLTIVKAKYNHVIRIALSGYTDKKVVLSCLDNNLAKIYLFKPWNNDEFLDLVDSVFRFEARLKDEKLMDVIKNFENLPTIPRLFTTISEMVEQGTAIKEIVKKIETDPAIASRILRIANSAYFGVKTGDISKAVMFIGMINVKSIILSNAIYGQARTNAKALVKEYKHCSITNKLLDYIYNNFLKKEISNEARSAGLLHNIGKGLLLINDHEAKDLPNAIDKEVNYMDHELIGSYLLDWWEMPFPLVESAMYHHKPTNDNIVNKELVCAVHLAQYYAWIVMEEESEGPFEEEVFNILGIDKEKFEIDLRAKINDLIT